jgi:hypothetical protein
MKRKVKRKSFLWFFAITSLFYILLLYSNRKTIEYLLDTRRIKTEANNTPNKPNRYCTCNWSSLRLKEDDYAKKHRPLAQKITENRYVKNVKTRNQYLAKNQLLKITDNDGYWVEPLTHSSMHLTPLAKKRLDELGRVFRDYVKGTEDAKSYFVISSVTRTEKQQKEIVKAFPNAATKGKSTHSYGVSIDINKMMYKSSCERSLKALEKALSKMQKQGKLLICPEKKCIHITIIN